MLQIHNLHATVADKPILKGLSLAINAGEIHAIMGPNCAGKSTLGYTVTEGSVTFTRRRPVPDTGLGLPAQSQAPDQVRGDGVMIMASRSPAWPQSSEEGRIG